jgi:HSP20 family protein
MTTLNQIHHGLHHAVDSLVEGWNALRRRASHALTHFALRPEIGESATEETALLHGTARWSVLAADMHEDDERILVNLEVPGMNPEDFDIEVVDDFLVIRGEKHVEQERAGGGRHVLLERAYGVFERAIHLPTEIDRNQVQARYQRGVLSVTLPKRSRNALYRVQVNAV